MKIKERPIVNCDVLILMTNHHKKGNRDVLISIVILPLWIWAPMHSGIAFFSGFLGTGVTPLTRRNVVRNNALDPAIILDPMFVANRVDSFTWSLYSSFDIANYVAGSKDLCDGFFPIKPVVVH